MWLLFTLLATGCWSLSNVFDHALSAKTVRNPYALVFVSFLFRVPIAFLLFGVFGFFIPAWPILPITFLGGVITVPALVLYMKAQQREEASSVMLMYSVFSPLMVLAMSFLFLGERLVGFEWIGFFLLMVAGVLSSFRHDQGTYRLSKIFWFMVFATFFWIVSDILVKYAAGFLPSPYIMFIWFMFGYSLGGIIFFLLIPGWRKKSMLGLSKWSRFDWSMYLISLASGIVAYLLFFQATFLEKISVVVAVVNFMPFFIYILEILFSKFSPLFEREDTSWKSLALKGSSFVLFLFGIYLL